MKAKSMQILRDLYQTHIERFAQFVNTFPEEKLQLHGPLLLDPSAYFEQPIKLLVVGQETMGWHSKYDDIDAQLEGYREFNVGEFRRGPRFGTSRAMSNAFLASRGVPVRGPTSTDSTKTKARHRERFWKR
jgi:hypothetical protein